MFKAIIKKISSKGVKKAFARFVALCVAALTLYSIVKPSFDKGATLSSPIKQKVSSEIQTDAHYSVSERKEENTDDKDDEKDDDDETAASEDNTQTDTQPMMTLEDFMSRLTCNGCSRHCSLLHPSCASGEQNSIEAVSQYEAEYGDSGQ